MKHNLEREGKGCLDHNILHVLFLQLIQDDYTKILKLMGGGYVSQKSYGAIIELSRIYSRGTSNTWKWLRYILTKVGKTTSNGITKDNIGNML